MKLNLVALFIGAFLIPGFASAEQPKAQPKLAFECRLNDTGFGEIFVRIFSDDQGSLISAEVESHSTRGVEKSSSKIDEVELQDDGQLWLAANLPPLGGFHINLKSLKESMANASTANLSMGCEQKSDLKIKASSMKSTFACRLDDVNLGETSIYFNHTQHQFFSSEDEKRFRGKFESTAWATILTPGSFYGDTVNIDSVTISKGGLLRLGVEPGKLLRSFMVNLEKPNESTAQGFVALGMNCGPKKPRSEIEVENEKMAIVEAMQVLKDVWLNPDGSPMTTWGGKTGITSEPASGRSAQ